MTENPTAPPPTGLPQPPSNTTPTLKPDEVGDTGGEIRCICECNEDDGYTVCCDKCQTWQHVACMQLLEDNLPSDYMCSNCLPQPVEAKRARELQRQRRRDEKNNRRKRSATASHKKKEIPFAAAHNGVAPTKATAHGAERTSVAKLPSPKEPQAPTSRKRNQRSSHSVGHSHVAGSSTGSPVYIPDRTGDAESDTDLDKYRVEFSDISQEPNKYTNEAVRSYLFNAVAKNAEFFKRYAQHDFAVLPYPKTSVRVVPDSSKLYSEHSRWCFVLESACARGRPVALFKGEVGFQDEYKDETINQYALWHHPKPYVVFHPELRIYVDARRWGSEARFVRRSCRPNLMVKTIVVDDSNVNFGLFAAEPIKAGTELTLGWDWNGSKQLQRLAEEKFDFSKLTADEMKQAALWVENLIEKMGDCACSGGSDCLLAKVKKSGGVDSGPAKRPLTNGNGKKQRAKRNPSSESNPSKEASPDFNAAHDDGHDSKVSSKVKPRSRDLTPALPHDIAVDSGTMTGREARKLKDVLLRIEKQAQEEQVQPHKRRKRSSATSDLPTGRSASPGSGDGWADENKRPKSHNSDSPATSPRSNGREVSVVDAGTGRSPSSSTSSHSHKVRTNAKSPVASTTSSKIRRRVKTKGSRSNYVNSSMQTEADDDLPWWKLPVQTTPPRPPRLPLRKRLMQSLLRDREEAAATPVQDRKRKLDCFTADTTVSLQSSKVQKVADSESIRQVPDVRVSPAASSQTLPDAPPIVVKGLPSPRPIDAGPTLENLFADADRPRKKTPQWSPNSGAVPAEKPQVNGARSGGLHLQLPLPSFAPSGPISPGLSTPGSVPALSPLLTTTTAPPFSPSVLAAVGIAGPGAAPSPIKTKKLSLQDYRKRHKVSDSVSDKKDEDASTPKSALDPSQTKQLAFLNVLPTDALQPTATPQTSVDSKITASTWGVR